MSEPAVTREIDLDAPPEEVWDAITDPEMLTRWLAEEAELEAAPGGEVHVRTEDGVERHGVVERAEPYERLTIHWWSERADDWTTVDFRVIALPRGGTLLRVTETPVAVPQAIATVAALPRLAALMVCVPA